MYLTVLTFPVVTSVLRKNEELNIQQKRKLKIENNNKKTKFEKKNIQFKF